MDMPDLAFVSHIRLVADEHDYDLISVASDAYMNTDSINMSKKSKTVESTPCQHPNRNRNDPESKPASPTSNHTTNLSGLVLGYIRTRFLQVNTHFATFFTICKFCSLQ